MKNRTLFSLAFLGFVAVVPSTACMSTKHACSELAHAPAMKAAVAEPPAMLQAAAAPKAATQMAAQAQQQKPRVMASVLVTRLFATSPRTNASVAWRIRIAKPQRNRFATPTKTLA